MGRIDIIAGLALAALLFITLEVIGPSLAALPLDRAPAFLIRFAHKKSQA